MSVSFDPLTHFALLRCFCHSLEGWDLFGDCQRQQGLPVVLNSSPGAILIFSTPHSIFSARVLFLVTKFLFLELVRTGTVSRFV